MTGIQWLLLILVVAAVAVAYWYLRRQAGDDPWQGMDDEGKAEDMPPADSYIVGVRTLGTKDESERSEPAEPQKSPQKSPEKPTESGGGESFWQAFSTDAEKTPPKKSEARVEGLRPQKPPTGEESLFLLHVATRDGEFFDGPDIHAALKAQKLEFGQHDIYHRLTEANGVPESVYSVANILKPGYLDPGEEDHLRTPGLALFLLLPGPIEGVRAMRDMLDTAHALAEALDGEVLDDKRTLLTPQTTQYMLDRVAELDRQRRVRASR